jgi:transposase
MDFDSDDLVFLPLKVVRTGPSGKRTFGADGKRRLIEACRMPGVSISGMALKAGINANQLHKWLRAGQPGWLPVVTAEPAPPAFVPVAEVRDIPLQGKTLEARRQRAPTAAPVRLSARLANGVAVELECGANDCALVRAMIAALGTH